jgi:RNA polymerase sigma-70 factor (ECF subfamily)
LRSPWHRRESLDDHIPSVPFTDPQHSDLYYSVMALPRHYRVPLYLHYYEGYSTDEIGELLKLPGATVRTRLRRARQLLQNELEGVAEDV